MILPTSVWALATAVSIIVVLVAFSMYWYYRSRLNAILPDCRHVADLAARKQVYQSDVTALRDWLKERNEELLRLQSEREEQERLRNELARLQMECATHEQRLIDSRKEAGDLESQRYFRAQEAEKLGNEIENLKVQRQEFQDIQSDLISLKKEKADLQPEVETLRQIFAERDSIKADISRLEEKRKSLKEEEEKFNRIIQNIESKGLELETARKECSDLLRSKEETKIKLETIQNRLDKVEDEIQDKKNILEELKEIVTNQSQLAKLIVDEQQTLKGLRTEIEDKRFELNSVQSRLETTKIELEKSQQKSNALTNLSAPVMQWLKEPSGCLEKGPPEKPFPYENEEKALAEAQKRLSAKGLRFHDRVLKAFHTSLKCQDINPLTVLAGVSGTGKTLLPLEYSQLMGMHSLVIPVQPRWDSPQDLFGFYNYLEQKYVATDLARALIRMDGLNNLEGLEKNQKREKRMLLVLLDEMNLARIEYYFSEFLSRLELRRNFEQDPSDANRQHAQLTLDMGPGANKLPLMVGRNVLFTGTMNEDETTQTLSDKVIDRANVLRFGRPENYGPISSQANSKFELPGILSFDQWKKWLKPQIEGEWVEKTNAWINELNDALQEVGRPFGHRVKNSILSYIANYPGVDLGETSRKAFADQIEQKILPKLRGLDSTEGAVSSAFEKIERIIHETKDEELKNTFNTAKEQNSSGMFVWHGVTRRENG